MCFTFNIKMSKILIEPVEDDLNVELLKDHRGEKTGWYYVGTDKYLLPSKYAKEADFFYNFKTRPDDVWIVTFPRSGTTMAQELVWLILNKFDFETASKLNLWTRTPFFELDLFFHDETKSKFLLENENNQHYQKIIEAMSTPAYITLDAMQSPRLVKTHFPISLLPKGVQETKSKIIYIARNPKDILPSYFYLLKLWRTSDYKSSFENFWRQFKNGKVPWGPFWSHIKEAWNHRQDENILFLFYEDIINDMSQAVYQIADFLQIHDVNDEQVKKLLDHMDIKNFCKNPTVNFEGLRDVGILNKTEKSFIRTSKIRERPNEMTENIEIECEKWILENYKSTDLRIPSLL